MSDLSLTESLKKSNFFLADRDARINNLLIVLELFLCLPSFILGFTCYEGRTCAFKLSEHYVYIISFLICRQLMLTFLAAIWKASNYMKAYLAFAFSFVYTVSLSVLRWLRKHIVVLQNIRKPLLFYYILGL